MTPGPSAVPTPTVTPSPTPTAAPDTTAPARRRSAKAKINQAKRQGDVLLRVRRAAARSSSCKLDKRKFKPCTSPKTYKQLKPGKHVFRVKARDRAGNVDKTPTVKRFKIARRR